MRQSGAALLVGAVVLVAAAAFGSRPLGVAGIGLVLAGLVARAWARQLRAPLESRITVDPAPATEGHEARLRIAVARPSRALVGSARVDGSLARLGRFECPLRRNGRSLAGTVLLGRLPRGRFTVVDAVLELGEPLGLETSVQPLEPLPAVVVHPRTVELETLFAEAGRIGGTGRRMLLRRPAGFDFHSVREYEQGESLRRVHWPTTARRGQLMVKELEDAPREAVVVILDCDPAGAAGDPPESSFDAAARAAGSVLRLYATRGRRASLVTTGKMGSTVSVSSLAGDFHVALDALAAAEPDAAHALGHELGHPRSPVVRAGELVVVTGVLDERAVDSLLWMTTRREVSVVWIDTPSFAGRPSRSSPSALRLAAAGIPLAIVRRGDDLATALEIHRQDGRAHG
jgi:uncharacterized protein (DUF58 family)